ncbi:MAG: hypothetical protein FJ279_07215, partial [Planctomycetes bacterium]|nr:hypothetical protein [Planctomycetota bacterium]
MMATLRRDALLVLAFSLSVASAARAEGKASDKARQLVDFDPAPLPAVRLPATRPRVWFAATDLPELRKRCQTTHKAHLDRIRQGVEDGNRRPGSRAFDLAFLYQMTGDANHARQAIALAREAKPFAWVEKNAKSVPCGDFYAGMADPLACVFDWCNDQLTADDRATIGGVLRAQLADGPYRTQFHVPWWMAHWLSNILALFDAGIDDKLANDHLAAYNRSLHQFTALADEIHADSAMGDYHHQYNHLMLPAEMWLRATGEN